MQLPGQLREAIEQELSDCDATELRAAAARLSQRYRQADSAGGLPRVGALSDEIDRAAYMAVRMPATFAAITAALRWTRESCGEECAEIRSVLDLGSGPGTALWAAAHVFPTLVSATAVERDRRLIEIGCRLAAHSEDEAVRQAQWLCGDLTSELPLPQQPKHALVGEPAKSWDLVVCAYALNEIGEGHRARLIRQAWERCAKLMVIVEPGTKTGFANVLAVRGQMLTSNGGPDAPALLAPCPHSLACPMAAGSGVPGKPGVGSLADWCHFAARVERSSFHRRLKEAELGHEDEKFSYVAFTRGAQRTREESPGARIVRHPRILSGYTQLTLCTEGRLEQATVTRSQREAWRRLKRLGWGDRW